MDEPTQIYLNCYRVLHGSGDNRAGEMLRQAYDRLRAIADKIENAAIRAAFWENVPAHRQLLQLYHPIAKRGQVQEWVFRH